MLTLLSGFADNVLAVSASGEVTAKDYREVLVPAVSCQAKNPQGSELLLPAWCRFLRLQCGGNLGGYQDWHRSLERLGPIAVTDVKWVADAVRLFGPLFHHPVRVFGNAEEDAAREWIIEKETRVA